MASELDRQELSVLVVDDAPEIRELLRLILARQGCSVRLASDAEEALGQVAERMPDVVLLDIGLPGGRQKGLELCALLKGNGQPVAPVVVMLTADNDPRTSEQARALGADGYVIKPFTAMQILGLVDAFEVWRMAPEQSRPSFWPMPGHPR